MADYAAMHHWVIASTVEVTPRQARRAVLRGSVRMPEKVRIDALEVYCKECRRPWDDVVTEPCAAAAGTEHLRGGPIGERKKRKQYRHEHDCARYDCQHDCVTLGCPVTRAGTQPIPLVG
jgi:hypothetical protein